MQKSLRQIVLSNLIWFAGSLVLAFVVWMFAIAARDPIEERRLPELATINFLYDSERMILTNVSSQTAAVRARGQRSNIDLLTTDDVTISADLRELPPGTHQVVLQTESRRERVFLDTVPRQVTVTIDLIESRLVPVRADLEGELPIGYALGDVSLDVLQTTVSGAAARVAQVDSAVLSIDLTNQRSALVESARLTPVDAEGNAIADVTLEPEIVSVTVGISQRPDVREVSVQLNPVGFIDLPEGYILTGLSYEPRSVLVTGPPEILDSLPETFTTAPIDLANRTSDFETTVPVILPTRQLTVLSGQTVTVSVSISAQTASRQFDGVAVEVLNLGEGLEADITPAEVTLLITGPQPMLDALSLQEMLVTIDLIDMGVGSFQLAPQPNLAPELLAEARISVLPASIDVRITDTGTSPTPTVTPSRQG